MKTMFRVQLDHENAKVPKRAHPSDVGFDLYAPEDICIWPHSLEPVNTYVRLELKPGYEGQVRSRSGLAMKKQLFVLNQPGTIDCFSEDMLVKTLNGDKNICDVHIGEIILSVNDEMSIERDIITAIIDKGLQNILIIETNDGNKLECTENTIVYTNRGLVFAKDIKKDDEIFCI